MSLGILSAAYFSYRGIQQARETTLRSTQIWIILVVSTWAAAWLFDLCLQIITPAAADHVWYTVAVLSLSPPIAVLGARRPGTRVWNWFILLPMWLVLGWPVAAVWLQGGEVHGIQLETPQLIAFCLVLVMGIGNYCGTSYTLSALAYGVSVAALVLSMSIDSPTWMSNRSLTRFWCTIIMVAAVFFIRFVKRRTPNTRFDRLWFDFFDTFGIVWGRRIQDRVNHIARKEGLLFRLELDGFVTREPFAQSRSGLTSDAGSLPAENASPSTMPAEARMEHLLRWLLRRFVDPAWIDRRLESSSQKNCVQFEVDS